MELKQVKYTLETNNSFVKAKDEEISQLRALNAQVEGEKYRLLLASGYARA